MSVVRSRFVVRTFATFVLFTVLAGQFWRNLGGWWGFAAVAAIVIVGSAVGLIREKPDWKWRRFPKSLIIFMLLATLSVLWSFYPGASALGIALQWITTLAALFVALVLSWAELLRTLSSALRFILGLSLLFELYVSVVVGHAVLPFFVHYDLEKIPLAFYWSRGLLLNGGPIEGIVANRNLLGFLALLAMIVFAVQLAAKTVRRGWGLFWLIVAATTFLLTRSATVTLSAVVVLVVFGFALWARSVHHQARRPVYLAAAASLVVAVGSLVAFFPLLPQAFGKSDDLTGRFAIWASVTELAAQRPAFGWGWVSYWAPWVEPFNDLAVRNGVTYLQAHNAWLDVWLQLGIVGLVVFVAFVFSTTWRAWFLAIDRPRLGVADTAPYAASALLPLLILAALLAQSFAESRLLVEYGWLLLVVMSVMTKRQQGTPAPMP